MVHTSSLFGYWDNTFSRSKFLLIFANSIRNVNLLFIIAPQLQRTRCLQSEGKKMEPNQWQWGGGGTGNNFQEKNQFKISFCSKYFIELSYKSQTDKLIIKCYQYLKVFGPTKGKKQEKNSIFQLIFGGMRQLNKFVNENCL